MSYPGGDARGDVYGVAPLVTGDAVVLELRPAGFATRVAALAIDVILQVVALLALAVVMMQIGASVNPAATAAISLGLTILILVGYPTAFESLSRGRSLGKMALGLRVVGTDGSPERFRQALARALSGVVEFWMTSGVVALITSMINREGRRVGDFVAGTMVVEERSTSRRQQEIPMPPQLAGWAAQAELSGLSSETADAARQYVLRYGELAEHTRHEMGAHLADSVAAQVSPPPPPGTTPPLFLAAVLAERRRRSLRTMTGTGPSAAGRQQPGPRYPAPHYPAPTHPGPQWSGGPGRAPAPDGHTPPHSPEPPR